MTMEFLAVEDEEVRLKRTDVRALKILARWIAAHDGVDPDTGMIIDREFVVVEAHRRPT